MATNRTAPSSAHQRIAASARVVDIAGRVALRSGECTMSDAKVAENRLRRVAERRGLVLHRSRRRDPHCPWFGKWMLAELHGDRVIGCVRGRGFTLVDCGAGGAERWAA